MSFIDDISFLSNEMLDEVFSTEAKETRNLNAKKFFSSNNSNVSDKRIADLEKIFLSKFDETIRNILSKTKKTVFFDNGYRLLSFDEIKDCGRELGSSLVKKKLVPVIDCGDNEFIIYSLTNSEFAIFSITDNTLFSKKSNILEYF